MTQATRISLTTTAKRKPKFKDTHPTDYCSIAWKYAVQAVNDKKQTKHCKWVRLAAGRFIKDYRAKRKSWHFDEWHANDVCDFIEKLPHIEGVWDTPEITLEPAQIFILVCVFGFRKKDDNTRRFSDVYIEMARKGAKSTLTAGICLYCLTCEGEPGAQVLAAASTFDQALKVFEPARLMAAKCEDLREAFSLEVFAKSVVCKSNNGYMKPINSKGSTQDGHNPHLAVTDELHAHKTPALHNVLKSAFGARKNPLMWRITTAGFDPTGVCYGQRNLVTKFLSNIVEADHYFGIIFTLDDEDEPLDPKNWVKANPMIGITPTFREMKSFAKEAKAVPATMGEFKTKRLNIWTTSKGGWLNMEKWKRLPGNAKLQPGQRCWGGVDLANVSDLCGFHLNWWEGEEFNTVGRYYLCQEAIDKRSYTGDLTYQNWVESGLLIVTPGERTDFNFIENDILEAYDTYDIQQVGFDPYNAAQTINNLTGEGVPVVEVRQGAKTLHPAMQEFERLYLGKEIRHDGNPIFEWAASNVVCKYDSNNNKAPDKKESMDKIDPVVACLNGLVMMIDAKEEAQPTGVV